MNSILQVRDSATGEWINIPALVGPKGEPGQSGVYVGPGEIPEGCNIQIDPTSEAPVLVQSVNGVKPDENGNVEVPGAGGSECSLKTKKIEVAITEAVSEIVITFTREDAELWNKATRISVLSYCQSGTPWNIQLRETAVDGTVTVLAFTDSIAGWRTDITHLLPIGNIATRIETNSHTTQRTDFYARQLFDSNTATISFVLAVENGDPVPPGSYMKVFIEGVM